MSEQSLTRRGALMAAASLGSALAVADAQAGDINSRERRPADTPTQFKISVTLTDGQVVTFNATQATIDFGTPAILLVKPSGIVPACIPTFVPGDTSPTSLTPTPEPNRRAVPRPENDASPLESPFERAS